MATDAQLIELIPDWLAATGSQAVRTGLGRAESIRHAERLLHEFTAHEMGKHHAGAAGDDLLDVLSALVHVVLPRHLKGIDVAAVNEIYTWSTALRFAGGTDEQNHLQRGLADLGWRACGLEPSTLLSLRRQIGDAYQPKVVLVFPARSLGHLFDYCSTVAKDLERAPARATRRALQGLERLERETGGLFDEREYFKAELAWMAGVAARFQGDLDDASRWFTHSEVLFQKTLYPAFGLAKIAFSQLALLYLNYQFDDVVKECQRVRGVLDQLGMQVWAAKCQHVEAMAEKIRGRPNRAVELLRPLLDNQSVHERPLLRARVLTQLGDCLVELGRHEDAAGPLRSAATLIEETAPSASSADFWAVLGGFLSVQALHTEALKAFRRAKAQYLSMDMCWLAAYVAVLIAEVALLLRLPSEAAAELRWALPILRQEGRIPEGCAAAALLEHSLKQKQLDSVDVRSFREAIQRRNPSQS